LTTSAGRSLKSIPLFSFSKLVINGLFHHHAKSFAQRTRKPGVTLGRSIQLFKELAARKLIEVKTKHQPSSFSTCWKAPPQMPLLTLVLSPPMNCSVLSTPYFFIQLTSSIARCSAALWSLSAGGGEMEQILRRVHLGAAFHLHIHSGPVFSPIKENADDGLLLVPDGSFFPATLSEGGPWPSVSS
jgi:hypothetical protein